MHTYLCTYNSDHYCVYKLKFMQVQGHNNTLFVTTQLAVVVVVISMDNQFKYSSHMVHTTQVSSLSLQGMC